MGRPPGLTIIPSVSTQIPLVPQSLMGQSTKTQIHQIAIGEKNRLPCENGQGSFLTIPPSHTHE